MIGTDHSKQIDILKADSFLNFLKNKARYS